MTTIIEKFLFSCVNRGVSENDLGYLLKWSFHYNQSEFKEHIISMINIKFFDQNNKISEIVNYYL